MGRKRLDQYGKLSAEQVHEMDKGVDMTRYGKRGGYYPAKVRLDAVRKRKTLMRQRALSGAAPLLVSEIRRLEIKSNIDIERVISGLFPRILLMVENRDSIATIEDELGMPRKLLAKFLERNEALNEKVKEARAIGKTKWNDEDYDPLWLDINKDKDRY